MKRAAAKKDAKLYQKQHLKFHETFILASNNELLINMLTSLRNHSIWYRFSYKYAMEDLSKSFNVHKKIFQMFKSKKTDPNKLDEFVKNHIAKAMESFRRYFDELEENGKPSAETKGE